jgi:hypothetical protein
MQDEGEQVSSTGSRSRRSRLGSQWTEHEREHLRELVRVETPIPIIADRLGRSQEAVRMAAQKAGLLARRRPASTRTLDLCSTSKCQVDPKMAPAEQMQSVKKPG